MLTVNDLFTSLSFGALSNLAMSNEGSGEIRQADQNKVINALNESLRRIYARFALSEKQMMISQYEHITNYHLDKRFAMHNPERLAQHYPYILDLPNEQFNNDVIKIIAVYSDVGRKYHLNNESETYSLFTPSPNILQVPLPKAGEPLSIHYQAAHPTLEYGVKEAEVFIPLVLKDALLARTAYSVYSNMNTQEATVKAAEHLQMYDTSCSEVEDQGWASITDGHSNKFHQRGFV